MFKVRETSTFFLVRDGDVKIGQDNSFVAKVGDEVRLKLIDREIEIHALITEVDPDEISAKIVSYHPEVRAKTTDERLKQIREDEDFINNNNLTNGKMLKFKQRNIYSIFR